MNIFVVMKTVENNWFKSWFNTRYYHILYKNRNDEEAQFFIKNLTEKLHFSKKQLILDLACGKGRHAIYLNKLGYHVIGADLSENNIAEAKKYENDRLQFFVHDMRKPLQNNYHVILNLFTSFGFFEVDNEHILVLKNIKEALKTNGFAVIDFMNTNTVIDNLIAYEEKTVDNITFKISRYIKDEFIVKEINFNNDNEDHTYFERIKILPFQKIKMFLKKAGLNIKYSFGDYSLNDFDSNTSERLILIVT